MDKRLLIVFPHPDDETYGCGGTIPKEVAAGTEVTLLTLTHGEASSQGPKLGLTRAQMGEKRAAEMIALRDHFGLSELILLDFPDGRLAELDPRLLEHAVHAAIEKVRPQVIVSYPAHGISGFIDHLVAHAVVKRCFVEARERPGGPRRFAMQTVDREIAERASRSLRFDTDDDIDCAVDVREYLDAKRIALDLQDSIRDVIASDNIRGVLMRPVEHYVFWGESFSPPLGGLFESLPD